MNRKPSRLLAVFASLTLIASAWAEVTRAHDKDKAKEKDHKHTHGSGPEHIHAPVPAEYSKQGNGRRDVACLLVLASQ
jgi:hypothetical protein